MFVSERLRSGRVLRLAVSQGRREGEEEDRETEVER